MITFITLSCGNLTRAEAFSIADGGCDATTRIIVEYTWTDGERARAYGSPFRDADGRPWETERLARCSAEGRR